MNQKSLQKFHGYITNEIKIIVKIPMKNPQRNFFQYKRLILSINKFL
jgi:hypothetical protein